MDYYQYILFLHEMYIEVKIKFLFHMYVKYKYQCNWKQSYPIIFMLAVSFDP